MKRTFLFLSFFLTIIGEFSNSPMYGAYEESCNQDPPYQQESFPLKSEICQNCSSPVASCMCYYPTPGCYPSAPVSGTTCGVSYLSMGVAIALIVGVAAIILANGENVHAH